MGLTFWMIPIVLLAATVTGKRKDRLLLLPERFEVGKSAELAVLDSDIEAIPVEEIQDIIVLETVFMGKTVFKKA